MDTTAPRPDPLEERMPPQRLLFSLQGRISRRDFWIWGVLVLIAVAALLHALLRIAGVGARAAEGLVNLLVVWPAVAVSVKRWHDRDKSGWWVLISLVPVIGWLWALVETGFLRGTPGPNRFGEDPLQSRERA